MDSFEKAGSINNKVMYNDLAVAFIIGLKERADELYEVIKNDIKKIK